MDGRRTLGSILATGLAAIVLSASSLSALAQSDGGASQDPTRGLTDPKNGGVAGTGMGTTDKSSGGAAGTGMSVKGPAGQGITGSKTRGLNDADTPSGTKPIGR